MNIPRLIIAATQSGSGKTTITTGILAAMKKRGLNVQAFKVGPDYIDPGYHEMATGNPSYNLDSWLVDSEKLRESFLIASQTRSVAVIEGVMGLYDGGVDGVSSTAQISALVKSPVILVIDVKSMGASAAAIALGFREFDKNVEISGVILNRVGSDSHAQMIIEALNRIGMKCFGVVKRNAEITLPERHLGLVPAAEKNFDEVIEKICATVSENIDIDGLIEVAKTAPPLDFPKPLTTDHSSLAKSCQVSVKSGQQKSLTTDHRPLTTKIAVAKDAAFNFYYEDSLRELEKCGAEIVYFSPLTDDLPEADGLIIGGGFPEIFAEKLQANKKIRSSIRAAALNGLPIFAECGGFMYLMRSIVDFDGNIFEMCGVIDSLAVMTNKLQMVGYVDAEILSDCVIGRAGDKLHAHEFHFSTAEDLSENIFECRRLRTEKIYRAGFADKNIVASYLHINFAGCPSAAKSFVNACVNYSSKKH